MDQIDTLNNDIAKNLVPNNIVMVIFLLLGFTGNICVVSIYLFIFKRKHDNRFFIPILGASDLAVCCIGCPLEIWMNMFPLRFTDRLLCKSVTFSLHISLHFSAFLTVLLALQRYLKVCVPYSRMMAGRHKHCLVILAIVLGVAMASPLLTLVDIVALPMVSNNTTHVTGFRCAININSTQSMFKHVPIYQTVLLLEFATLVLCIFILYVLIGRRIYLKPRPTNVMKINNTGNRIQNGETGDLNMTEFQETHNVKYGGIIAKAHSFSQTVTKAENSSFQTVTNDTLILQNLTKAAPCFQTASRRPLSRTRFTTMVVAIGLTFVISYIPMWSVGMLVSRDSDELWTHSSGAQQSGVVMLYQSYLLNHVINPAIYGLMDMTFRRQLLQVFKVK